MPRTNSREAVERQVISAVKPDDLERARVAKAAEAVVKAAGRVCHSIDRKIKVKLVGSVAKDTWLTGAKDIDVFLILPSSDYGEEELEEEGLPMIRRIASELAGAKTELKYAQHPYVMMSFSGYDFDLVPCIDGPEIISAVDRTPAHTEYVNSNLNDVDSARLLKQFCIGAGTYGADMKNQAFSGYLCELLVIKFGSFFKAMEAAAREWRPPQVRLELGNDKRVKFSGPLVFIDPVDQNRNVASAVSKSSLERFIAAANHYLKSPSIEAFFPKELKPLRSIPAKRNLTLALFPKANPAASEDVVYSQLRSLSDHLLRHGLSDFEPQNQEVFADGKIAMAAFEFGKKLLPKTVVHIGPPVTTSPKFADAFRKKYGKGIFEEEGRLKVRLERKFRKPEELLEKELHGGIIPKYLGPKYKILSGPALGKFYKKTAPVSAKKFITKFLEKEENPTPWSWK